jgi:hypothetical protein
MFRPANKEMLFWGNMAAGKTSIRTSRICLRLYFVVDYERRKFCETHDLLPPPELHGNKLISWIDRRRNGDKRTRPKKIRIPLGQLELPLAA